MTTEEATETTADETTPEWAKNMTWLKQWMGYDIYVTQDGKFSAKLPGRDPLQRQSLDDVQAEIRKLGTSVKAMTVTLPEDPHSYFRYHGVAVREYEVMDFKMSSPSQRTLYGSNAAERYIERIRDTDGDWHDLYGNRSAICLYDQEIAEKLMDLDAEQAETLKEHHERRTKEETAIRARYRTKMEGVLAGATVLERQHLKKGRPA